MPLLVRSLIDAASEIIVVTPVIPGRLQWLASDTDRVRPAQLMEARIRKVDLMFHPGSTNDLEPRSQSHELIEQRRLPDSWLAMHDDRSAATISHGREQFLELRKLALPTHKRMQTGSESAC